MYELGWDGSSLDTVAACILQPVGWVPAGRRRNGVEGGARSAERRAVGSRRASVRVESR